MATIASYISAGGLGDLIFLGMQTVDLNVIFAGALPLIILALGADRILVLLQRKLERWREDLNKTPEDRFVSEITVNSISTVASDKTLKDALTVMLKNDAGYIAVSDENRKPVGLITSSRLRQIVSEPRLNSREEQ